MNIAAVISFFVSSICTGLRAEVCNTPGCLQIASFLNKSMDLSVDPCDDFYNFVCGNYIKELNNTEHVYDGVYVRIERKLSALKKTVLEANSSGEDPEWLKKGKNYYQSCMDTARLDKYAILTMKQQLKKIGGWPVLDAGWDEADFDWLKVEEKLYEAGMYNDQLVAIGVFRPDGDEVALGVISIDSRYSEIPIDTFLGGMDGLQTYLEALVGIAVVFGADRQQAENDMQEVLQFEISLANLTALYDEPTKAPVPKTISELQRAWPYISWLDMIQFYIGQRNDITENEPVIVAAPFYLENLGDLLSKTPKRVLANYLMSKVVFTYAEHLNQEVRNLMYAAVYGSRSPTRSEVCYEETEVRLFVALAAGYVRKYVTVMEKQDVTEMAEMLRKELIKVIEATDWISNSTKIRAISIVRHIRTKIAYPDELLNDTFLNDYFKDLKICPRNFLKNHRALMIWYRHYDTQKLHQPALNDWDCDLETVFDPSGIFVPQGPHLYAYSGTLTGVQYSADRPMHVNLGTLAIELGHEFTHSLDPEGIHYNETGQIEDWWDSVSEEEYIKREKALVDEYSTYVEKSANVTLNGEVEINEIIADEGGYKIARNAVNIASGKDQKLPGLEQYSAEQIFWIASSTFFCSNQDPQMIRNIINTEVHPPDDMRVNPPLRNSQQFAQDWSCPLGSFMNPKKKFNVW